MHVTRPPSRAPRNLVASLMLTALLVTLAIAMGGASAAPSKAVPSGVAAPPPAAKPQTAPGCWSVYAVQDPGGFSSALRDVAAVSEDDVWAVGSQSTLTTVVPLIEHWNGSGWSIVANLPGNLLGQTLDSVAVISANSIWAAGSVTLLWDGSQWDRVSTPDVGQIVSISAVSANDVWAVSVNNSMHWNGTVWTEVPIPTQYLSLLAVDALSTNDVWAVGSGTNDMLHWDGTQWNTIGFFSPGIDVRIQGVVALSATDVWAVGRYVNSSNNAQYSLALHWDGIQWNDVDIPNIPNVDNELSDASAISSDDIWAVGDTLNTSTPTLLTMHWDGATWSLTSLPASGYLSGVAALSSNDVWAVGGNGPTQQHDVRPAAARYTAPCLPPSPTPTATSTGTSTRTPTITPTFTAVALTYCWTSVPAPDAGHSWTHGSVQAVSALSANDIWVLSAYQDAQGVFHTVAARWNGSRWGPVSTLPFSAYDMVAISDNDIWAVGVGGDGEHWDGSHWTVVTISSPSVPINALYAIDGSSSNNVWAVGLGPGNEDKSSGVVVHWDGTRWSGSVSYCYEYRSVKVISSSSVWVGGNTACGSYDSVLLYWDGTSWLDGGLPPGFGSVMAIGLTSLTDVWVSMRGIPNFQNQLYHSDGLHWTAVSSQGLAANHIEPISPNDIWASTNSGTLLHWNGTAWGRVDFPGDNIADVGAVSSNDVWAVGTTMLPNDSRMLTLHYNTSCVPTPRPTATVTPTPVPPPCPGERFTDVCPNEYFYPYVQALTDDGILYGYASAPPCRNSLWIPCFNPNNPSSRGQISKIVTLAAGFNEPVSGQQFEDVPPSSTFYTYTERMAERGIISGYPCGGPSEPCIPPANRPYFRTNRSVSRGQLSKMVALAFQWDDAPTGQVFEDVPPGAPFYTYTVELYNRGLINGYPCGGPNDPCVPPGDRPYFRPSYNVLRGQTAKIVQLARTQPTVTPTPTATETATVTLMPTATSTDVTTPIPTATGTPTNPACQGIPPSQDMEISPGNCEPAGTSFAFTGSGFQPGESVSVRATDPNGVTFGAPFNVTVDGNGYAGPVTFDTQPTSATGQSTMTMDGLTSQHQATGYFVLLPAGGTPK